MTKCGKCHGRFLRTDAFSRERTGIIVYCIVGTFALTVLCAQFPLCRSLAAVFHCITVYKQPPPSYIDSTTMLSDSSSYYYYYSYSYYYYYKGEEELEEENDKMWKMSRTFSTHWRVKERVHPMQNIQCDLKLANVDLVC